ncbi:ABC transporter ATP-binding protein [Zymobacter palmae]|uniref:ABC-type multidrug transport system, ATPase n=1 Tax=Zymobacter palmae TaxID=33074 RepID=A0A348HCM0_9GAMM|nr:ABC transporter ATP-binding protein [Zymobacter palmae]BBG29372.1 ABC-type multidrug transport system, ATPase [Zymobacter palmae]
MGTPALSIRGLTKTYGTHQALKGIDLDVAEGDFFALLGPNGAGKSTTLGILSSLVNKTSGKVEIFGRDIDRDFSRAKFDIGFVNQEFNFNQFEKVEDIITAQAGCYGIRYKVAKARAEQLLEDLGLYEKRNVAARMLSGGMKRRLLIARALVHEPRLLILDEPTAGVDIELRRSMWEYMQRINREKGMTIILTTHYLEEAESLCRNIAIIDKGQIVQNTSMRALLQQLDTETFILDTERSLAQAPMLEGFELRRLDDMQLELVVPKGRKINDAFAQLSEHGIEVMSMRNRSNRLEELFVSLVDHKGREIRG